LSKAPLMRLTLLRLGEETYQFIWTWHHLLMDGWSSSLVTQEVFAFYKAFCAGRELTLPESRPYRDYIVWLHKQNLSLAEEHWRRLLKGFTAPTPLLPDRLTEPAQGKSYDEQFIRLSKEATDALQTMARQHRVTLNTLVQGSWALLL